MIEVFNITQLDEVMQIWLEGNIDAHDFILEDYWRDHFDMVKRMLPDADIFVLQEENIVKGFIGVVDNGYIAGLFVRKQYQGQGVGRQLLDHCKTKYTSLTLDVFAQNRRAYAFYCASDFTVIGEKMNSETQAVEYTMRFS